VPLLFFVGVIQWQPNLLDARLVIPIAGMIMGNCMSADVIGVRGFYDTLRSRRKAYRHALAQGARLNEATGPYFREALRAALAPTVARTATIGLVSLPGMMTGQMLGGAEPMTAIMYQIAIMIAIFTGTAITVFLAVVFTRPVAFDAFGRLREDVFSTS
jgi:putative ABC transport system permease protein